MGSKLEDGQCSFCMGRSTTNQIFTQKKIFEKSWKYGKDLSACFVNPNKAYDQVLLDKLWKDLREYGGSTNAAELMSVPQLEIAKSVVCYLLMIWFCFLPHYPASRAR